MVIGSYIKFDKCYRISRVESLVLTSIYKIFKKREMICLINYIWSNPVYKDNRVISFTVRPYQLQSALKNL